MTFPLANLSGRDAGFNIDAKAVGDWNYLHATLRKIQPRAVLVMDNVYRAKEIADMLPNSVVSARFYHADDTKFWKTHQPFQAVNFMLSRMADVRHDRLWFECNCEPTLDGGITALLNWEIEVAQRMADLKLHYVTAFAVGKTIEKQDVENGLWDKFIHELQRNPYFHFGVHEYGYIFPMAPYMPDYPRNMFDGAKMHPDNWPKSISHERNADGSLPDHWHMWRSSWVQIQNFKLGYTEAIEVLSTEGILDIMDDVANKPIEGIILNTPPNLSIKEWLKSSVTNGRDVKGIPTLAPVWKRVLPQYGHEEMAAMILRWVVDNTPPWYVAICVFSWTLNEDWVDFDIQTYMHLHNRMAEFPIRNGLQMSAPDTKPVPPTFPALPADDDAGWGDPVTIKPKNKSFNLRSEPSTRLGDDSVIANFTSQHVMWQHESAGEDVEDPGHTWVALKMLGGKKGWAALDVLEVEKVEEEPEPTPEPEPEPEPTPDPEPIPDDKALYPAVVWTWIWQLTEEKRKEYAYLKFAEGLAMLEINYWHLNAEQLHKLIKDAVAEAEKRITSEMTAINLSEKKPADKPDSQEAA